MTECEQNFISVERVLEYVDTLPSEFGPEQHRDAAAVSPHHVLPNSTANGVNAFEIGHSLSLLSSHTPLYERLSSASADDEIDNDDVLSHWPQDGTIVCRLVSLRYSSHSHSHSDSTGTDTTVTATTTALREFSVTIPSGDRVAVVGRTGSGKSSMVSALLRLHPYTSGSIEIGGIELSTVPIRIVRNRIIALSQDPVVFSSSVRDNVDPLDEYSDAEVAAALADSGFVASVANHMQNVEEINDVSSVTQAVMNSKLGCHHHHHHLRLSHGQKQLLALARVFVRLRRVGASRACILVLDEATSAMDAATRERFKAALLTFLGKMKSCTLLLICHRPDDALGLCEKVMIHVPAITCICSYLSMHFILLRFWKLQMEALFALKA